MAWRAISVVMTAYGPSERLTSATAANMLSASLLVTLPRGLNGSMHGTQRSAAYAYTQACAASLASISASKAADTSVSVLAQNTQPRHVVAATFLAAGA